MRYALFACLFIVASLLPAMAAGQQPDLKQGQTVSGRLTQAAAPPALRETPAGSATTSPNERRSMEAVRMADSETIALDGRLDEDIWLRAVPATNFRQIDPAAVFPQDKPRLDANLVDARDGKTYRTVRIGQVRWLAENLAYLPHVSRATDAGGIWVYGYNGDDQVEVRNASEFRHFGALYDWNTAMTVCPSGWHLPTDDEWKRAEQTLGMSASDADAESWRGTDQGTRMKEGGSSGLNVVLAGWRSGTGRFNFLGEHANFWTATPNGEQAVERLFNLNRMTIGRGLGNKTAAFSVRCVETVP